MNADQLSATASLIIAAISLAWGIYQNIEKRRRDLRLESLQSEIQGIEISEKRHKLKPKLSMAYLETTTGELLTYSASSAARFRLPAITSSEVDAALTAWLRGIEQAIPFSVRASIIKTPLLDQLQEFFTHENEPEAASNRLFFLLLINEGNYVARDIKIKTRVAEHALHDEQALILEGTVYAPTLIIDKLGPQESVVALFAHITEHGARQGFELEPDGPIQFIDDLSGETHELKTRIPYEVARIVDKGLLVRG